MQRHVLAYEEQVRLKARKCFESGYGYKKTATLLQIPTSTVRDWKRLWVKGEFHDRPLYSYKNKYLVN